MYTINGEEGFWFLAGFVVALLFIIGMYVFISYQGYRLAKEIENEYAWLSFIPALQLFVFVLLYKEIQGKFSTRELMLLFIGVPFVLNFVSNMGMGIFVLNAIYGVVSVVLLLWLVGHVVQEYTPQSSSTSYAVLSFFTGNVGLAVWSLRHREEIVKVYAEKIKKEDTVGDAFEPVIEGVVEFKVESEEKVVNPIDRVEITDELREELFKDVDVPSSRDADETDESNDVIEDTGTVNEDVKKDDEESRNKAD